jgi:hypothetical protein
MVNQKFPDTVIDLSYNVPIPDMAGLRKEENGVRWYVQGDYANAYSIHYMEFGGEMISGCWCGPRWVFWALTQMSSEERAQYRSHDEIMGAIGIRLRQWENQ